MQGAGRRVQGAGCRVQGLYEICFNLKFSGNEVYHTIFEILLVKIMLCSKLHHQKFIN